MNQTRLGSLIEVCINIAIGFSINWVANLWILPLYGFQITGSQAFTMGLIFTVISVVRSYVIRRYFNARLHALAQKLGGASQQETGRAVQFIFDRPLRSKQKEPSAQSANGVGDVNGTTKGSGARYNTGKPDYSLIPLSTLADEARVWQYGANKYAAWNWARGMQWSIPYACLMRHLAAWQSGEACDSESGLPHLAHAACNLRMLMLYATTYPQGDNRPPKEFLK